MSVRSLIGKIPFMTGCQDADRFSERNLMGFDAEINNPDSVFSYRESDSSLNRLAVAEIPAEYVGDARLYRYAMDRVRIAMLSQDKAKGRISPEQQKDLELLIADHEANPEPEVDAELTLEASTMDVWS